MAEVDDVRVQRLDSPDRVDGCFLQLRVGVDVLHAGHFGGQLVGIPYHLGTDHNAPIAALDEHGLVTGRVTGRRQNGHPVNELFVAPHSTPLPLRSERPAGIGVVPILCHCLVLGRLGQKGCRTSEQGRILATVIEVKMAVDHGNHLVLIDAALPEEVTQTLTLRVVQLVDEAVSEPDTGIDQDRTVRVQDA